MKNETYILSAMGRVVRHANRRIEQLLQEHAVDGIVASHGDLLFQLFEKGPLSMNQVAQLIDRDKSTVTALVTKLIHLGYITKQKDPQDARVSLISLSPKGEELQPIFRQISEQILQQIYQPFSEDEKQLLMSLLRKIEL
jgi:DNA-binding MarR family transcriptional regulator